MLLSLALEAPSFLMSPGDLQYAYHFSWRPFPLASAATKSLGYSAVSLAKFLFSLLRWPLLTDFSYTGGWNPPIFPSYAFHDSNSWIQSPSWPFTADTSCACASSSSLLQAPGRSVYFPPPLGKTQALKHGPEAELTVLLPILSSSLPVSLSVRCNVPGICGCLPVSPPAALTALRPFS